MVVVFVLMLYLTSRLGQVFCDIVVKVVVSFQLDITLSPENKYSHLSQLQLCHEEEYSSALDIQIYANLILLSLQRCDTLFQP